ncbi:MAG: SLBB domain-containing protein [Vicinamibacterales bacterium]
MGSSFTSTSRASDSRWRPGRLACALWLLASGALLAAQAPASAPQAAPPPAASQPGATVTAAPRAGSDYEIGAEDILQINLYDQEELGGRYPVDADGTFTFPLVGRVQAGGLTLRQVEGELRRLLMDGYFRDPQLSVSVEQYRSQKIFMVGEVRNPGTYPLTGQMSLIEAIARAGSTLPSASGEAIIVRKKTQPDGASGDGPTIPRGEDDADVETVNLKSLQSGELDQNVVLQDGDTIFVPRAETIYVFGQVKSPGAYPITRGTTVLQALSLAGGITDRGSTGRIKIVRLDDGNKVEIKVKLDYVVRPGDTIIVPERFF